MFIFFLCTVSAIILPYVSPFPDPGLKFDHYDEVDSAVFGVAKPLFSGSSVYISVNCEPYSNGQKIELQWVLRQTSCFEDSLATDYYNHPNLTQFYICPVINYSPQMRFYVAKTITIECTNRIHLQFIHVSFKTYSEGSDVRNICPNMPPPSFTKFDNSSRISEPGTNIQPNSTTLNRRERRNAILNVTANTIKVSGATEKEKPLVLSKQTGIDSESEKALPTQKPNKISDVVAEIYNETKMNNDYTPGKLALPEHVKPGTKLAKLATVDMDGIYLFVLRVRNADSLDQSRFNISVDIAMKGDHGYLSAVDYPLLMFYAIMCALYVIYAVAWLVMSALQWRDLIRIQFWIGAVILLGLMEKAVFYAEYQSINYTGESVTGAILFAEILSCMKRTLARMLIIIVSLGFGIVKPRLGPMLHRIIGVGALYFCLGSIEGCLRVLKSKADPGHQALMAGIPLAVTDSAICWWIFSSLVQTIRTLRLRRNIVKLQLYKHFTNALLLSVVGSVAFMTWSIHAHKLVNCITDWKELWVDEAYWHFLFSVILFVIMILWRPTNNNQRYAFTPLLDAMDDDDEEDDEENHLTNDAFDGMKMRTTKNSSASPKAEESKTKQDEDLKWVEENIPTSLTDVALPSLLDSDEEIMTAKFERSKME